MRAIALVPLLAAATAACDNGKVEMKNASVEQVANAVAEKGTEKFIDPGQWEQTVTLVSVEAPGMPAEARSAMQQAMKQPQVHSECLTPEQAKSPREDFFTGKDQNCRYEHFNWGGGKIDLKMLCKHPNANQTMQLSGNYEPRRYSLTMTATSEGATPEEQLVMTMKVDARHVGQCTAKS